MVLGLELRHVTLIQHAIHRDVFQEGSVIELETQWFHGADSEWRGMQTLELDMSRKWVGHPFIGAIAAITDSIVNTISRDPSERTTRQLEAAVKSVNHTGSNWIFLKSIYCFMMVIDNCSSPANGIVIHACSNIQTYLELAHADVPGSSEWSSQSQ